MFSRVSSARVRVSLRIRVRFTFGDRVGIGFPKCVELCVGSRRVGTAYVGVGLWERRLKIATTPKGI